METTESGGKKGTAATFLASGGWVVLLAVVATSLAVGWNMSRLLRGRHRAVGDGRHVETYGFALEPCLVDRATLVAAGIPKDGIPSLVRPATWTLAEYRAWATGRRSRFLVASDRVVGLSRGGEHRAYPLRLLAWHEVVNDSLGGDPVVVTYNPLCDSVVVVSATVGGVARTFGVSGLLSNSNLLLYDRNGRPEAESLWSQLQLRAVTGPAAAAGSRLSLLPSELTTWGAWCAAHPDTTVLAPVSELLEDYARDPYTSYFGSDELRFPVAPLMPTGRFARKTPTVVVELDGRFFAAPVPVITAHGAHGAWTASVAGRDVRFVWQGDPPVVDVLQDPGDAMPVVYAFMFAWQAAHPHDTSWIGTPGP